MRFMALASCFALASCARAITSSPLPDAQSYGAASGTGAAASYATIFRFNGKDGEYPSAGLTAYNGILYGVTASSSYGGYGAFFKIASNGAEKTLSTPIDLTSAQFGPLVEMNGVFYGTTYQGGGGYGTVFRVSPSGAVKTLHVFSGAGKDGHWPRAGLVAVKGTLYGTTAAGGTGSCASQQGCGTVFKITTAGKETVLHSFKSIATGSVPEGGLAYVDDALYGTAEQGGTGDAGIVYRISLSGSFKVVYNFKGAISHDGYAPTGNLTVVKGLLYGTTEYGGTYSAGNVFSITTSGTEKVLYSFKNTPDAAVPSFTSLAYLNDAFYGTTICGGTGSLGTIFKVTTSGAESVLHSFAGGKDGSMGCEQSPGDAGPAALKGKLYGVAPYGGSSANYGTVYSIAP
jgi:uncharacterized repeat protein (TIGR03803 family)